MQQNNNWLLSKWFHKSVFPVGIAMTAMTAFSSLTQAESDSNIGLLFLAALVCSIVAQVKVLSNMERDAVSGIFQKTMYVVCIVIIVIFSIGMVGGIFGM